jgi:hypothetical protein
MSGPIPDRPELTALESALRDLAPVPAALDRDALLFRAGHSSVPRRWFWPAATAFSTTVAVVLALLLVCRPAPQTVECVARIPMDQPQAVPSPEDSPSESEATSVPRTFVPGGSSLHRRLEEHLLRWGLEGLGEPPPPPPDNPYLPPVSFYSGDDPL